MRRILFTGSRKQRMPDREKAIVYGVLTTLGTDWIAITGGATGVDDCVYSWCHGHGIHVAVVKALWWKHGRAAGPRRNAVMLDLRPDEVIAFPRKDSKGTLDMIRKAKAKGVPVRVYPLDQTTIPDAEGPNACSGTEHHDPNCGGTCGVLE